MGSFAYRHKGPGPGLHQMYEGNGQIVYLFGTGGSGATA